MIWKIIAVTNPQTRPTIIPNNFLFGLKQWFESIIVRYWSSLITLAVENWNPMAVAMKNALMVNHILFLKLGKKRENKVIDF